MPFKTGDATFGEMLEITAGEELIERVREVSTTPLTVMFKVTELVPEANLSVLHFNSVALVDSIEQVEPSLNERITLVPSEVL